jgi:molecular chaperone HtpG
VETYKPTSSSHDGPLKLGLSGPKNYLLIEKGRRRIHGTRIEVVLRAPMGPGEVTDAVSGWCRRVEFPIIVNELGAEATINSETPDQFVYEVPDVTEQGATLAVRQFSVDRHGVEGELYVFARRDSSGESWADWAWANYTYPEKHPQASPPRLPQSVRCINGIAVGGGHRREGPTAEHLDYRDGSESPVLARNARRRAIRQKGDPRISSRWKEIVSDHLAASSRAKGAARWKYIQSLVDDFPLGSFWDKISEAIPLRTRGCLQPLSLNAVLALGTLATEVKLSDTFYGFHLASGHFTPAKTALGKLEWDSETPLLAGEDAERLSERHRTAIFQSRKIEGIEWHKSGRLIATWVRGTDQWEDWHRPILWAPLFDTAKVGLCTHKTVNTIYPTVVFNTRSTLIQWLARVKENCTKRCYGLEPEQYARLREMFHNSSAFPGHEVEKLAHYIEGWRAIPGMPAELYPPPGDLTRDQFHTGRPPAEPMGNGSPPAP